jgi:hypothetical protein
MIGWHEAHCCHCDPPLTIDSTTTRYVRRNVLASYLPLGLRSRVSHTAGMTLVRSYMLLLNSRPRYAIRRRCMRILTRTVGARIMIANHSSLHASSTSIYRSSNQQLSKINHNGKIGESNLNFIAQISGKAFSTICIPTRRRGHSSLFMHFPVSAPGENDCDCSEVDVAT